MIEIDTRALVASLARESTDFESGARQISGQAVARALLNAQQTTSFKNQTGDLRRSIKRGQSGPWDFFITATAPHALYVEENTRPHRIEAKRANALRFVQYGRVRFARAVNHPGTRGKHFLDNAGNVGRDELEEGFDRLVDQVFR